jgi:hypothetical protein
MTGAGLANHCFSLSPICDFGRVVLQKLLSPIRDVVFSDIVVSTVKALLRGYRQRWLSAY